MFCFTFYSVYLSLPHSLPTLFTLPSLLVSLSSPFLPSPLPVHPSLPPSSCSPFPPSLCLPFPSYRYQGISKQGNAVYEVRGRHVGDTSLRVSAAVGGGAAESGRPRVESPARPIQVFPALTLHPRNITLLSIK